MHALLWVPLFPTVSAAGVGQCHTGSPAGRVSPWNHYTTSVQCLVTILTHSLSLVFISFPTGIENISECLSIMNMCNMPCGDEEDIERDEVKMDQCTDFISDCKWFLHPHIELGYGSSDRSRGIWWYKNDYLCYSAVWWLEWLFWYNGFVGGIGPL